jgi:hypothetical protein
MKTSPKTPSIQMRAFTAASALAGILAFAPEAHGDETSPAPSFAALPVGRTTAPPRKRIGFVSARESVAGLFVSAARGPAQVVQVTADANAAARVKGQASPDARNEMPAVCITQMQESFEGSEVDEAAELWNESISTETHAYPRTPDTPAAGVIAVHTERVVEQGGAATLESVDAWVDPSTRGARLIAKASLPLTLVHSPGFGVKVYAGRDERPDGKRFVQFVVVRPRTSSIDRTSQMWSMRLDGEVAHSAGCAHQRVALAVDGNGGAAATIVATAILPELDASGKAKGAPAAPSKPTAPTGGAAKDGVTFMHIRTDGAIANEIEVRSRMMHVQVSVSQTSRTTEPLVSVSSSWGGREQLERVFEPGTPVGMLAP